MTWLQRHQVRHYFRNSIWIVPVLSIVLAIAAVPWLHDLEEKWGRDRASIRKPLGTVLGMMASSMFTFIVFVCSALLIAVQLASAQLTPRIIAFVFRDPVTKFSLTVFVFTFTFALAVLVRTNTEVPLITARLSAYSCIACLGVFLFLIDHVGKWFRPAAPCERSLCWAARSLRRSTRDDCRDSRRHRSQAVYISGNIRRPFEKDTVIS